jgi:hypothetical protein
LVKSVARQVVAGQPSDVAGRPLSLASIDLQLGIPLYRLLESVTAKPTHKRLQGGAGRPRGLVGWPPLGPNGQRSLHIASSFQVHPRCDTNFGGIPNFLVIS